MKKKISNKIICLFIFFILLPIFTVHGRKEEVLDQSTPLGDGSHICGINNDFIAQSFKPKLPVLSKIELGLFKNENITGNFTISIRTKLYGEDIISKTISTDDIPYRQYGDWVEFDIEDINVTNNKRYYIISKSDNAHVTFWIMAPYTPYWKGRPWMLGGLLPFWIPMFLTVTKLPDMSFRTYGYDV